MRRIINEENCILSTYEIVKILMVTGNKESLTFLLQEKDFMLDIDSGIYVFEGNIDENVSLKCIKFNDFNLV